MKKIYLVQYYEGQYQDTEVHTIFATELEWLANNYVAEFNKQRQIKFNGYLSLEQCMNGEADIVVAINGFVDTIKPNDEISNAFVTAVELRVAQNNSHSHQCSCYVCEHLI